MEFALYPSHVGVCWRVASQSRDAWVCFAWCFESGRWVSKRPPNFHMSRLRGHLPRALLRKAGKRQNQITAADRGNMIRSNPKLVVKPEPEILYIQGTYVEE